MRTNARKLGLALTWLTLAALLLSVFGVVPAVADNTVPSSTMIFQGTLTDDGGGVYSGILPMVNEAVGPIGDGISGYDVYARNGATAWFGDDPGGGPVWTSVDITGISPKIHDAWPTWSPDTPDWYQYSLNLYVDGGKYKWAVRNHPGATAAQPWYVTSPPGWPKPPMGVPMSGSMDWMNKYAFETDTGAYLPLTGTPEIPDGAASKGGGPACWDMDWSWGSEVVPLEYTGFDVDIANLGGGQYRVTLTPAAGPPTVWVDDDYDSNTPGWGFDHFDKIQDGINAVGMGGTVYVLPGNYYENLVVTKPLTLSGAGAGVTMVYPATSDTGDCTAPALRGSQMVVVKADDVTIEGFTFDGNNPGIGGAIDARNGIVTDPTNAPDKGNNLTVRYCEIKNIFLRGVEARGVSGISGIDFNHNTVDNVQQCPLNSVGLELHTNASGSIKDNTVTNCAIGIFMQSGSDGEIIENEVLYSSGTGIGVNSNNAPTKMCYNTVIDGGTEGCMQTVSVDAPVEICCNEISSDDSDGIIIMGGQSHLQEIYDNYIHDGYHNIGLKITTDLYGWGFEDSHGVNAWGNRIIDWDTGVLADVPPGDVGVHSVIATVSGNNISGNATWGANNNDPANSILTVTNNWWGCPTGPNTGACDNVLVSPNVPYTPWAQALVVLDPWRTELHECEEVRLAIKVKADNMYGIQFIVHFDPANLDVTDADWTPDPFFPDQIIWDAVVDNVNGTVKFAAYQKDPTPPANMDFHEVAYVVFHCHGLSYDHIWLEDLMLGEKEEGEEILSTYTSACIKNIPPAPGSITGQVDLQGRADDQGAFVFTSPGGYWAVSNSSGNYTISNVPPGTYTVDAEMSLYLDGSKGGVVVNTGVPMPLSSVKLLGGDCNDSDGTTPGPPHGIDINDAIILGGAFGSSPPSDARADVNADGTVNILDAVLLGGNWHKSSPVPWP